MNKNKLNNLIREIYDIIGVYVTITLKIKIRYNSQKQNY